METKKDLEHGEELKEIIIKDIGKIHKLMDMEFIFRKMEINMKENGQLPKNTEMGLNIF